MALNTPTHTAVVTSISGTTAVNKDLGAPQEAEGWKNVLQLLREQNKKMKKLARAFSVIQQGMLRNNPGHVRDSFNEVTEVLRGMLNTHKCLLESEMEFQKRLKSHPASKRMSIFRRSRSASLGDTPKELTKWEKRVAPSPPEDRLAKKCRAHTLCLCQVGQGKGGCRSGSGRTSGHSGLSHAPFVTLVMKTSKLDGRAERGNNGGQ